MRSGPVSDFIDKGVLRPDLTPDEAAAILWVLVDPALHHRLVRQAGWSAERFRDWLYEAFVTQLLVPREEQRPAPRSRSAARNSPAP